MIQIIEYQELDKEVVFETTSTVAASLEWRKVLARVQKSGKKAKIICKDLELARHNKPAISSETMLTKIVNKYGRVVTW